MQTSSLALLLLSLCLALAAKSSTDPLVWKLGMEPAHLCVSPGNGDTPVPDFIPFLHSGSSVTFSWSGSFHNVVEVSSKKKLSSCTGFGAKGRKGQAGPHTWKVGTQLTLLDIITAILTLTPHPPGPLQDWCPLLPVWCGQALQQGGHEGHYQGL